MRHWQKQELPLVSVLLQIEGGAGEDAPAQAGRAYLTAGMLDEGAGALGAIEFSDALDQLGADFLGVLLPELDGLAGDRGLIEGRQAAGGFQFDGQVRLLAEAGVAER